MFRYAVGAAALTLVVASAAPAAAQRVRAGVLTCDISAGMSFIVGSQKSVVCTFAPEPPGPQQVYSGSITKFGLDVGATGGGVMVWAVFTDSIAPPGTVALQPISVDTSVGLNFALGVAELHLRAGP
ncbi:MAG TPA: DUF992 domain-containing protein [Xanthobacteraceae bacterium]|nr:DUF992 domain-containing protein [Xanthobacteraceae bacterium]